MEVPLTLISDRFAERAQFLKSVPGIQVQWTVTVADITNLPNLPGSDPPVLLTTLEDVKDFSSPIIGGFIFPASFTTRLYALKKGDRVNISGIVKSASPINGVVAHGMTKFLPPSAGHFSLAHGQTTSLSVSGCGLPCDGPRQRGRCRVCHRGRP